MAPINLRNVTVRLQDGYKGGGGWLVNLMAGYMAGATSIAVDGGTTLLVVGNRFIIPSETGTPIHTIVTHTETLGITTAITSFTPALVATVADDAPITILPHILDIKVGEGNLSYDEKRKVKYILDRGRIDSVRLDDDEPMDVKFEFIWEYISAAQNTDPPTPDEALKNIGNASDWVTSSADPCEPYSLDVELLNAPPCTGSKVEEDIILPDFRWEGLNHDAKANQVSVTGKCNALYAIVSRK